SAGNFHDISHLSGVYSFARLIAQGEGFSEEVARRAEAAAIVHDISCPLCRTKYGDTRWDHQEAEGGPLALEFLRDAGVADDEARQIAYIVAHHHTWKLASTPEFQTVIEADFIQNAGEQGLSPEEVHKAGDGMFKTRTGREILNSIWPTQN
ncbi:MAG: HD domain-containing protein, partial [Succinivibrio sp.]